MSEVAKLLDGIPVELPDGTIVRCRPPTVAAARILMAAYNRIVRPPLEPPAPPAEGADEGAQARYTAQLATFSDRVTADEGERRAAWQQLLDTFPEAVGQPTLAEQLSPGDLLHLVPDFFWKRTGARVPKTTPAPMGMPVGIGTPAGGDGSPPSV
jgi:hypothetical protein